MKAELSQDGRANTLNKQLIKVQSGKANRIRVVVRGLGSLEVIDLNLHEAFVTRIMMM